MDKALQGYLTYLAGGALSLLGLAAFAWLAWNQIHPDSVPCPMTSAEAGMALTTGLGLIGIKRAVQENTKITQDSAAATQQTVMTGLPPTPPVEEGKPTPTFADDLRTAADLLAALKARGVVDAESKVGALMPDLFKERTPK